MLFPTTQFLVFFCVVFALHWRLVAWPRLDKAMLLAASWFFYACWDPRFLLLLAFSAGNSWIAGRLLDRLPPGQGHRAVTAASVGLHLLTLGFFKYYAFFVPELLALAGGHGIDLPLPLLEIVLPVGISFFTFQGISYVVDVARGDARAARDPLDVFLYISFFPHLVAGPIVRAANFLPQLAAPLSRDRVPLVMAGLLILGGLFKKMVIANGLATGLVDPVFADPAAHGALDLWLATYGYAIQIYCDFSAYSDIAIGVAALLGFHFPRNFDQPYRARSLAEFWRRWHISLSSFLRDYLYRPLGGNRRGPRRTMANLLIVMLLGGLWHGAAWTFVLWGLLHGLVLALERLIGWKGAEGWRGVLAAVIVFHVVCAGWVLFRSPDVAAAGQVFAGLFGGGWSAGRATPFAVGLIALGLALHWLPAGWLSQVERALAGWPAWAFGLAAGVCLVAIDAAGPDGVAPFIYFRF
ncbi:D-alanyl-lipoteichoic acid acyltransferase DltB (MBOAT superfamily) [Stella humosa]|uniref:Probable alginate O-acetylase AlgI n=1 Tax=Stella humosa TaxID=94 RepID=A0A3N1L0Y2_9PROT|nr:MBOAT family protein [Stella humosa]ROP84699.1 D-alanyl-lipoteichoic acid acyltransferase DltB (MBOAT superfamily) [Stella humosa]BBK34219.1 alginate O-acetyltransferase [Stella humosa]